MNSVVSPIKLLIPDIEDDEKVLTNEAKKMCMGLPYVVSDADLVNGRSYAKLMCFKFNQTNPTDLVNDERTLKELLTCFNWSLFLEQEFDSKRIIGYFS